MPIFDKKLNKNFYTHDEYLEMWGHIDAARAETYRTQQQLAAANERVAALEGALQELMERTQESRTTEYMKGYPIPYTSCLVCGWTVSEDGHREDCPVVKARELLEGKS